MESYFLRFSGSHVLPHIYCLCSVISGQDLSYRLCGCNTLVLMFYVNFVDCRSHFINLFWIDVLYYFDVQMLEHVERHSIFTLIEESSKSSLLRNICHAWDRHIQFVYIYVSGGNQIQAGQLNVIQALLEVMLVHKADAKVVEKAAYALHQICKNGLNNHRNEPGASVDRFYFFKSFNMHNILETSLS